MRSTLRAGLFGLGMMGRNHARILRSTRGIELVGVCDPHGDSEGAAGGSPLDIDPERLIARGLDMAIVAAPTGEHVSLAVALAIAGVPTLIEKPLAVDLVAGQKIVAAFEANGVLGAVGHVERCNGAIRSLRDRIGTGDLGDLFQVSTSRQGPFPDRIRDVGVIKDLATHDLDLVEWVTGRRFQTLSAEVAHRAGRPYEDLLAVVGRVDDGIVVSTQVNWLNPTKQRQVSVLGERGCLTADTLTADLTYYANGVVRGEWEAISKFRGVSEGDVIRYAIPKPEPLRIEIEAFRDAVLEQGEPVMPLRDGLRVLEIADAVSMAASTSQAIAVTSVTL
jgi:UDP-N-acetylglucosamine 3-dehydrogenase